MFKPDINRIRQRVADHRAYERVAKEIAILNHKYAINAMVDKDLEKWMKTPPNVILNIPVPQTAIGAILDLEDEREYFEIDFPEELDPDNYIRLYEDDEYDGHY